MTVTADRESRVVVENAGFANPIALDQYVESDTHVEVYADEVLMTIGVDYTIAGIGTNDGIEVTILAPGLALAPDVWVVFHNPPLDQGADLSLGGNFGLAFEQALDAVTRRLQSVADKLKRGISLSITTPLDVTTLEFPPPIAGRSIKWNSDATALINTMGDPDEAQDVAGLVADAEAAAAAASAAAALADADRIAAAASAAAAAASAAEAADDQSWIAAIGVQIQAFHANLSTLAGLASVALLSALANLGSTGLLVRTGAGAVSARTITGSATATVTDGNGVSANPTISVANPLNGIAMNPTSIGATTRGPISGTTGNFNSTLTGVAATFSGNITGNSDLRLKREVVQIEGALAKLLAARGVTYRLIADTDDGPVYMGVIAQELLAAKLDPLVVTDEDGYLSVAYGNGLGAVIEALREIDKRLRALEAK